MEPIREGASGAAVEDIQERLGSLGYKIDEKEAAEKTFGHSTATAVARFRLDHGLSLGDVIDTATWAALVDECYQLGDRTLYLRLPNFHGNDVRQLQERLNVLGFSCGAVDGQYGAPTPRPRSSSSRRALAFWQTAWPSPTPLMPSTA